MHTGRALRTDTLEITHEILGLIAEVDEFKGAWRALGTLAPERLSALRRKATIESIGSSTRIEGSKLTDAEVEDRVVPLLDIKPLASVRFWLTYTERVRNLSGSQPILHWIRSCFDPRHHACFREVFVLPTPELSLPPGSPRAMP